MKEAGWIPWRHSVIGVGLMYLVIGLAFGALAHGAPTHARVVTWRFLAWAVSGVLFAVQIGYEQFRLRNTPLASAWHASLACGLGALGLAAAACIHAEASGAPHPYRVLVALVAWPFITMIPAFIAALAVGWALSFRSRGA